VIEREDAVGLEYDWLAVDADGFVALFSTAGAGFVPDALLRDPEGFDGAIDAILEMPARTIADCDRELAPGRLNTWRRVAERGLFAFDSDPLGGPYRLVAKPHAPVRANGLPSSVASVAGRIVLPTVSFKNATEVRESEISSKKEAE
jgi:hypothetical protein